MINRRGSFTVQIVLLFSAMLILTWAVLSAAGDLAIYSTAEDFGRLWGTSILAEYDLNLKDRYGLFGFYGDTVTVERKLDAYAVYTFGEKAYIEYGGAVCSLDDYSLTEPEQLKQQMSDAVLFGSRPHGLHRAEDRAAGTAGTAETHGITVSSSGSRTITSRWILDSLPSAGDGGDADVTGLVSQIKSGKGLSALLGSSMVNQYILTYFQHYRSTGDLGDTYFRNEIEYIICGKPDDEKARKKVRQKLIVMRNLLNLAYLYASPEKREAAMALAEVMTPGPEAVITQGVLLELWAFAEAENDLRLLYDDKPVPLIKSDSSWAMTLENAMEQTSDSEKRYITPSVLEGESYEVYLRILLSSVPDRTRLLRVMDLIQINMKYLYCDYFLLEDYHTGLQFSMWVNGEEHEFKESYERTAEKEGELSG
ncbi:MAG: DUF5702 domain-containing protein [Anaerovoracaceae bacterium]